MQIRLRHSSCGSAAGRPGACETGGRAKQAAERGGTVLRVVYSPQDNHRVPLHDSLHSQHDPPLNQLPLRCQKRLKVFAGAPHTSKLGYRKVHRYGNSGVIADGDHQTQDLAATMLLIEDWYVKTGQRPVGARIQEGAPFALMRFQNDSLERKAAMRGAFIFLASKHTLGLSFELRDHPLTTCELQPELQKCLGTALDKILIMCEDFPVGIRRGDDHWILLKYGG